MVTALSGDKPFAARNALQAELHGAVRLAIFLAALAPVFLAPLADMARIWFSSSLYHHGAAVAPIAFWLARRDGLAADPRADAHGLLIIALALIVLLVARAGSIAILGHIAVVTAIIGAVIASFGLVNARRWGFALAFLYFMVPFGDGLTPALQEAASFVVTSMLNAAGVETTRSGFMLTTSVGRFEMAESCAGLRFLLASAMISALTAQLAFRSLGRKAAFIAAALAAALIANWLRAFIVVALATFTDRKLGVGLDHVALGWFLYAALIAGLICYARRVADADGVATAPYISLEAQGGFTPVFAGVAALVAAALLHAQFVLNRPAIDVASPPLAAIHVEGWRIAPTVGDWQAHAPQADEILTARYQHNGKSVDLTVAIFSHDRPGGEIAGYELRAADGEKWRRIAAGKASMRIAGAPHDVAMETLEDRYGERISVATVYRVGDRLFVTPTSAKLAIIADKLVGADTDGGALFVAAPLGAETDIAAFFAAMEPVADWRDRALQSAAD
jgi:EpsI family protein